MKQLALFTFLILAVILAPAQGQSMLQMKRDAQASFEKADAELNAAYKVALSHLSPKRAEALKKAQRTWIILRDKTAEEDASGEAGGSLEGLMYVRSLEASTRKRTEELKKLYLPNHS